jgi:hypothetical protein
MPNVNPLPAVEDRQTEARCHCGQLVAKLRREGIELKCKRCKRIVLIPFESIQHWDSLPSSALS